MYKGPNRKRIRMEGYDYSENGYYFVTICTKNKECYFGEIINGKMNLNKYGMIVYNNWCNITFHYQNVKLDQFIIMPNHIHGIIIIENYDLHGNIKIGNENIRRNENIRSLPNLSNIIKGFKIGCTKDIRQKFNDYTFAWQKSFYDTIIRSEEELLKTREYIAYNPLKWDVDRNVIENIR